jgi:hypothetical protein
MSHGHSGCSRSLNPAARWVWTPAAPSAHASGAFLMMLRKGSFPRRAASMPYEAPLRDAWAVIGKGRSLITLIEYTTPAAPEAL